MNFCMGHQSSIAANAHSNHVQAWTLEQSGQDSDIKASVRRLLEEIQGRYRDLHGRDFKAESSAPPSYHS